MDKKTIKAILDVIKDVSDRPGLYGAQFWNGGVVFSDGYVVIHKATDEFKKELEGNYWVSGEQLKEVYKTLGTRDYVKEFKNDGGEHPNWTKCWGEWSNTHIIDSAIPIRPETFKKLAPFGDMLMSITENDMGQRLIAFNGDGVNAFVCPLRG